MKIYYIRPVGPTLYEKALAEVCNCKNKKAAKVLLTGMCMLMNCGYILAEEVSKAESKAEIDPVKKLGNDAISAFQTALTVIAIIMALFEVGKSMVEGDPKRIPSIVAKYAIGVVCVYAIPYGYFKIKDAFDGWEMF